MALSIYRGSITSEAAAKATKIAEGVLTPAEIKQLNFAANDTALRLFLGINKGEADTQKKIRAAFMMTLGEYKFEKDATIVAPDIVDCYFLVYSRPEEPIGFDCQGFNKTIDILVRNKKVENIYFLRDRLVKTFVGVGKKDGWYSADDIAKIVETCEKSANFVAEMPKDFKGYDRVRYMQAIRMLNFSGITLSNTNYLPFFKMLQQSAMGGEKISTAVSRIMREAAINQELRFTANEEAYLLAISLFNTGANAGIQPKYKVIVQQLSAEMQELAKRGKADLLPLTEVEREAKIIADRFMIKALEWIERYKYQRWLKRNSADLISFNVFLNTPEDAATLSSCKNSEALEKITAYKLWYWLVVEESNTACHRLLNAINKSALSKVINISKVREHLQKRIAGTPVVIPSGILLKLGVKLADKLPAKVSGAARCYVPLKCIVDEKLTAQFIDSTVRGRSMSFALSPVLVHRAIEGIRAKQDTTVRRATKALREAQQVAHKVEQKPLPKPPQKPVQKLVTVSLPQVLKAKVMAEEAKLILDQRRNQRAPIVNAAGHGQVVVAAGIKAEAKAVEAKAVPASAPTKKA